MALIVQKFGGTSVGSPALVRAVAARIACAQDAGDRVAVVVSAMGDATDRLLDLARTVCECPDERELDALLATGEQVSIALLAIALRDLGRPARSYTGLQLPVRTSGRHGRARIESVGTDALQADIEAGIVPIVAGFQGVAADGSVTTIGRGGSDTTAVALAVALRAQRCEILTDVDGVYTADPRVVPRAKRLDHVTFDEMLELAGQGSRVLHLRCVEFARKYRMPLRVAASHADGPGTLISSEDPPVEAPMVAGIAFNADEALLTVAGVPDRPGMALALIRPLADAGIEVDMIVLDAPRDGCVDLSFTVHRDDYVRARELVSEAARPLPKARVLGDERVAKVAVVGVGVRSHAAVATRMFETLSKEGVNLRMVSTSEIKISVLVEERMMERAVRALHSSFELDSSSTV